MFVKTSDDSLPSGGPLWSMSAEAGCVTRLWPSDTKKPLDYTFSIADATRLSSSRADPLPCHLIISCRKETLVSASITRSYLAEGVKRVEVSSHISRGKL